MSGIDNLYILQTDILDLDVRVAVNDAGKAESKPLSSEKTLSKEDVRAILAAKATESDGAYRTQIKDLVKKYGNGGSLTDVDPKDYAALTAEAKAIGNAG